MTLREIDEARQKLSLYSPQSMHRHVLNRLDTKRLHICLILCLYKQHTGIEACACAVYGRENRLKVKRDEEQAAKEEAEKAAIHQKVSSRLCQFAKPVCLV